MQMMKYGTMTQNGSDYKPSENGDTTTSESCSSMNNDLEGSDDDIFKNTVTEKEQAVDGDGQKNEIDQAAHSEGQTRDTKQAAHSEEQTRDTEQATHFDSHKNQTNQRQERNK